MTDPDPGEITLLLAQWKAGSNQAFERLYVLVYDTMRSMAAAMLQRERSDHTLQPTALVHEVYLRMAGAAAMDAESRPHFLRIASIVMRRILIDHARRYLAGKRIGPNKVSMEELGELSWRPNEELLAVDQALTRLGELNARQAQIVEMSFFGGLEQSEIALAFGVSVTTVKREWRMAKAWLRMQMERGNGAAS